VIKPQLRISCFFGSLRSQLISLTAVRYSRSKAAILLPTLYEARLRRAVGGRVALLQARRYRERPKCPRYQMVLLLKNQNIFSAQRSTRCFKTRSALRVAQCFGLAASVV